MTEERAHYSPGSHVHARPCPRCDGLGFVWEARCEWGCPPALLTDDEDADPTLVLPCGHVKDTSEEQVCPRCDGRREIGLAVDLPALGLPFPETYEDALRVIVELVERVHGWRETLDDAVAAWQRRAERERALREGDVR